MKKVFSIICIFFSLILLILGYEKVSSEKMGDLISYEASELNGFNIPESFAVEKNGLYPILEEVSKKYKANIVKIYINSDMSSNIIIEKGLIINNKDSNLLKRIKLETSSVENLDFYDEDLILSSIKLNSEYKMLNVFGHKEKIIIKPLKSIYTDHSVAGSYFVELENRNDYNKFILDLQKNIANNLDIMYTLEEIKNVEGFIDFNKLLFPYSTVILALIIINLLLLAFMIINSSRKISLLIFEGIGLKNIYGIVIGKSLVRNLLISILLVFISLIIIGEFDFLYINFVIVHLSIFYILAFSETILIIKLLMLKNSMSFIKNKKSNNFIFSINIFLKLIFMIVSFSSFNYTNDEILNIYNDYKLLKSWDIAGSYGVFGGHYNYASEEYLNNNYDVYSEKFRKVNQELYPILNSMGSVYISANEYLPQMINAPSDIPFRSISVNPNYLNEFHIKDEYDRNISISEDEEKIIVLVPTQFNDKEDIIKKYFAWWQSGSGITSEEYFNTTNIDDWNKFVKIIYTKNNQKIFSFNKDIFPKDKNMILDPIIEVKTINNSDASAIVEGGTSSDPLKIKLINNNPKETYEYIKKYLIDNNYNQNLTNIVRANDLKSINYQNSLINIRFYLGIFAMSIILYFLISFQNLLILFNKSGRKFVIKRLSGISLFVIYKNYIILNSILFSIILGFILFLNGMKNIEIKIIIFFVFLLIEMFLTLIYIFRREYRIKSRILKGEE